MVSEVGESASKINKIKEKIVVKRTNVKKYHEAIKLSKNACANIDKSFQPYLFYI